MWFFQNASETSTPRTHIESTENGDEGLDPRLPSPTPPCGGEVVAFDDPVGGPGVPAWKQSCEDSNSWPLLL